MKYVEHGDRERVCVSGSSTLSSNAVSLFGRAGTAEAGVLYLYFI